jgi:hypothetical protein
MLEQDGILCERFEPFLCDPRARRIHIDDRVISSQPQVISPHGEEVRAIPQLPPGITEQRSHSEFILGRPVLHHAVLYLLAIE